MKGGGQSKGGSRSLLLSTQPGQLHYFTDDEEEIIDSFLRKRGYLWSRATVCGNCCGFYCDEYWVDGISGNFKDQDKKSL